jgi:hypothetical protein
VFLLLGAWYFARGRTAKQPVWERWLAKVSRPGWRGLLIATLFPLVIRVALLPVFKPPVPYITDEFAYVLAGDTYAHGRLTNPQHPLWKYFDSLNILVRPTYAAKYPPGQGLFLAAGQVLFHNQWFGVWLSVGLMCGSIFWMLEGFLGAKWGLFGALLAGLRFGIAGYWMNSYWGGAVAGAAGALVLGAAARGNGFVFGVGAVMLAISRPVEGMLFCVPALFILWRKAGGTRRFVAIAAKASLVILIGLAGISYQNWRVTGDPLRLPYLEHAQRYQATPAFVWNKFRKDIIYLDPFLELNYAKYEVEFVSLPFIPRMLIKIWQTWLFFLGPALLLPFLFVPPLWRDRRLRLLWPVLACVPLIIFLQTWFFPHYIAPFTCVFLAFSVQAFRYLKLRWGAFATELPLVICMTVACGTFLNATQRRHYTFTSPPEWCCMNTRPWERDEAIAAVEKSPGPQLLIVRYTLHEPLPAWVYNPADIDSARVIFARDYGACGNQELLRYYANRKKWLLEVDGYNYKLTLYPEHESCVG